MKKLQFGKQDISFIFYLVIILTLGLLSSTVNPSLMFERDLIEQGQYWRLFSASFVHLGFYHTLLNVLGFVFWYVLFSRAYEPKSFHLLITLGALLNGVMLLLFSPNVQGYAGFSGVLHGLILFSLILDIKKDKWNVLFVMCFWAKLIYEQQPTYDVYYLTGYMNAPVIVDAHLYGGIVGSMAAACVIVWRGYCRHKTNRS